MRTMHLFAGAGGGLLADLILGHTPIVAVEWDRYACQILRERTADGWFPDLQVWEGDVRLFDPSEYTGRVDCIHAGFPCQDLSNAGKQAGLGEGTRSGLYREVLRIAGVVRPRFIFLENVSAILGNGLGTVLGDLAQMGYDAQWCCIKASDVGANHNRDRWWLLAYSNSDNGRTNSMEQNAETNRRNIISRMGQDISQSTGIGIQRQRPSGKQVAQTHATEGLSVRSGERRGETYWSVEPDVGRVVDGFPARIHRIKALGNAQVPLQAALAFKLLMERMA